MSAVDFWGLSEPPILKETGPALADQARNHPLAAPTCRHIRLPPSLPWLPVKVCFFAYLAPSARFRVHLWSKISFACPFSSKIGFRVRTPQSGFVIRHSSFPDTPVSLNKIRP